MFSDKMSLQEEDRESIIDRIMRTRAVPRSDCFIQVEYDYKPQEQPKREVMSMYALCFVCRCLYQKTDGDRDMLQYRMKKCLVAEGDRFPMNSPKSLVHFKRSISDPASSDIIPPVEKPKQSEKSQVVSSADEEMLRDFGANLYYSRTIDKNRLSEYSTSLLKAFELKNSPPTDSRSIVIRSLEREMDVMISRDREYIDTLTAETTEEEDREIIGKIIDRELDKSVDSRPDDKELSIMNKYGYLYYGNVNKFVHIMTNEPLVGTLTRYERMTVPEQTSPFEMIDVSKDVAACSTSEIVLYKDNILSTCDMIVFGTFISIILIILAIIISQCPSKC